MYEWFVQLRYQECWLAEQLQQLLPLTYGRVLVESAHFGHPNVPYTFLFPFLYCLSPPLAAICLWTVSQAEYLNTIFKWIFQDSRPYFWLAEFQSQQSMLNSTDQPSWLAGRRVNLLQVPETCETGPGFPSGHVMITVAVWWVLLQQIQRSKTFSNRPILLRFLWFIMFGYVAVTGLGRVYISAHFLDQVIFGLLFGVGTGRLLGWWACRPNQLRFRRLATISMVNFAAAMLMQRVFVLLDFDPNWTLRAAQKHCFISEYAKADTTPMYVIWKTCGALFGAALTFELAPKLLSASESLRTRPKWLRFVGALIVTAAINLWMHFVTPHPSTLANVQQFYVFTYIQYCAMPFLVHVHSALVAKGFAWAGL